MTNTSIPKWQYVTGWVLSGLLGPLFASSAFAKIAQPAGFLDGWTKNYPAGSALPLGCIEIGMYILYLVPKTRYLGGLIMLGYLGGAVATHVHMDDPKGAIPVLVGIAAWLGLWLRDPKARAILPLTND